MANVTPNKSKLTLLENYLEIASLQLQAPLKFHYFWLRDHCRCTDCYNYRTHQINSDVLKIPLNIKPSKCNEKGDNVEIIWEDGHMTEFSLLWLSNLCQSNKKRLKRVYWDKHLIQTFTDWEVPYNEFINTEEGLKQLLKSILKYGFGFVTGVEPTLDATEKVALHIGQIKKTIFGEMWELTNDFYHDDTAYTTTALGAHTDNTYFTEASGLQIFHMLEYKGTGGETLLVDGFNAASNLRFNNEESFDILCQSPIESEYIEKGIHYTSIEPIIKLHCVTNDLCQIRYNIYDRAPMSTLKFDHVMKFYKAYRLFGQEINDPKNQWRFKLKSGNVLFFDNWRLLHGRASYIGKRKLIGCYISRRDWLSTAKHLGLPIY